MTEKQKKKKEEKALETKELHEWFKTLWKEREDENGWIRCFETDVLMHRDDYMENISVYDHVLEKNRWPEYKFLPENIVIIRPHVHNQKGINIDKTPRIKEYREKLLNLHYENKLNYGENETIGSVEKRGLE